MAKTWGELSQIVLQSRHTQFRPASFVPTNFTFYKGHIFFLGVPRENEFHTNENTLFYVNIDQRHGFSDMDVDEFVTVESGEDQREKLFTQSSRHEQGSQMDLKGHNNPVNGVIYDTPLHVYQWKRLLSDDVGVSSGLCQGQQYSKEDELLRERKRLSSHGITSYEFHHETGRILFQSGRYFYWVDTECIVNGECETADPHLIRTSSTSSRIDPKLNLNNGNIISFISGGDIYVCNIKTEQEMRLTFVRSIGRDDSCSAGVPSYVTQEEFDRFSGYWWEPKVQSVCFDDSDIEMHRVLYELVDESEVEVTYIVSPPNQHSSSQLDKYRYPRAGGKNAKSSVLLVEFGVSKETGELLENSIVEYELQFCIKDMFPWAEYLVRCGWMNDAQNIWMQLLDRRQKKLAIVRVPISAFRIISSSCIPTVNGLSEVEVIWEESSETWINLSDTLHFLPTNDSETVKFLWSSESTGYRHLYLITTRSRPRSQPVTSSGCAIWRCDTLSAAELTDGEWEVDGGQIYVDEGNHLVYFMGTRESPLEQQLYVVSYECASPVQILSSPGMCHTVSIDKDCRFAAITSSSLSQPTQVLVAKLCPDQQDKTRVSMTHLGWIEKPSDHVDNTCSPELFKYENKKEVSGKSHGDAVLGRSCSVTSSARTQTPGSKEVPDTIRHFQCVICSSSVCVFRRAEIGFEIYGLLFKPQGVKEDTQYPTVLFVYGGPAVQLVTNSQRALHRFSLQYLTSLGYVVVVIDTVGSAHRGLNFESQLNGKMGTIEISEQVEGLEYVARTTGIIDMSRVAIHGWSYGGYLSLMGLAQRPDIFKVAIAGAPVSAWELYDTGYTEKYMDLPDKNPEGYKNGSVLNYISKFPNEQNRLLLIHGMIDENVHFSHTNLIVSALIREGKPYQLQIYPRERHGIRNPQSAQHYETAILWFLQEYL